MFNFLFNIILVMAILDLCRLEKFPKVATLARGGFGFWKQYKSIKKSYSTNHVWVHHGSPTAGNSTISCLHRYRSKLLSALCQVVIDV